nr:hypothetical protein [Tanacetum cinerariifolium]
MKDKKTSRSKGIRKAAAALQKKSQDVSVDNLMNRLNKLDVKEESVKVGDDVATMQAVKVGDDVATKEAVKVGDDVETKEAVSSDKKQKKQGGGTKLKNKVIRKTLKFVKKTLKKECKKKNFTSDNDVLIKKVFFTDLRVLRITFFLSLVPPPCFFYFLSELMAGNGYNKKRTKSKQNRTKPSTKQKA